MSVEIGRVRRFRFYDAGTGEVVERASIFVAALGASS
jgi:hypothetical protein